MNHILYCLLAFSVGSLRSLVTRDYQSMTKMYWIKLIANSSVIFSAMVVGVHFYFGGKEMPPLISALVFFLAGCFSHILVELMTNTEDMVDKKSFTLFDVLKIVKGDTKTKTKEEKENDDELL